MAYYDFNGTITIDEVAAKRDIQKINLVIPRLEAAKATLDRLREEGEEKAVWRTGQAPGRAAHA